MKNERSATAESASLWSSDVVTGFLEGAFAAGTWESWRVSGAGGALSATALCVMYIFSSAGARASSVQIGYQKDTKKAWRMGSLGKILGACGLEQAPARP